MAKKADEPSAAAPTQEEVASALATVIATPSEMIASDSDKRAETWMKLQQMDIATLPKDQHPQYLAALAHLMGLNPMMKPFITIPIQGKLQVYVSAAAGDQLRDLRNLGSAPMYAGPFIPCWIDAAGDMQFDRDHVVMQGMYMVVWKVTEDFYKDGVYFRTRVSYDIGVNPIAQADGQGLADQIMKTWTKAERRAVLGHCGVGFPEAREGMEGISSDAFMPRVVEPQALPIGVSNGTPPPAPVIISVPPPPPPPIPPGMPKPVVVARSENGTAAPLDVPASEPKVVAAFTPPASAPPVQRKPIPPPPVPVK
jgi:hypothetical protein